MLSYTGRERLAQKKGLREEGGGGGERESMIMKNTWCVREMKERESLIISIFYTDTHHATAVSSVW